MRGRWTRTGRSAAAWSVAAGYALLACLATALALALRDGAPWMYPNPWLGLTSTVGTLASALSGIILATILVVTTRFAVGRFGWARRLHGELRPVAKDLSVGQIFILAGLSSLGEEVLFRGLLTPVIGVVGSGVLFGLLHQMRGPSRWVWTGWATAVGLILGAIFAATGSLVGPLLAHAIVNAVNLGYLRDHDPGNDPEQNLA
ncbi:CPBP family intramembrane glutamic endopeptidase [Polyangium sp. 15x6]|uniref:CPBP family intramembrane glutamic endopeptidase n=1 Tax=Polyangium sp. 15x6 TaxID=3042687 RepID=UPI00249B139C|nr:CPBP family intramembrane glutamic endopeptidase [Polyangium sp. 15x6]MDI3286978.1 CPBP family intramembrane metalloprotease [Polyangium sp. 15x6]